MPMAHSDADAALDWFDEPTGGAPLRAAGHCTGGHSVLLPYCLPDGQLAAEPDAATLARAPEIKGDLLLIFGNRDPHTRPKAGRQVDRR